MDNNIMALEAISCDLNVMASRQNYSIILHDITSPAFESGTGLANLTSSLVAAIETMIAKIVTFVREKRGLRNIRVSPSKHKAVTDAMQLVGKPNDMLKKFDDIRTCFNSSSAVSAAVFSQAGKYFDNLAKIKTALTAAKASLKNLPSTTYADSSERAIVQKNIADDRSYISCLNRLATMNMKVIVSGSGTHYGATVNGETSVIELRPRDANHNSATQSISTKFRANDAHIKNVSFTEVK